MAQRLLAIVLLLGCAPARDEARAARPVDVDLASGSSTVASSALRTAASVTEPASVDTTDAACSRGDVTACMDLAEACQLGRDGAVAWTSVTCAERERRACDLGSGIDCARLSQRYGTTTGDVGVPKDDGVSATLIERACELGGGFGACTEAGFRRLSGIGVPTDLVKARAFLGSDCDEPSGLLPQPCQAFARLLASGEGGARDEARAARIFAAACGQGACDVEELEALCKDARPKASTLAGCVPLAETLVVAVAGAPNPDPKRAVKLLERACSRKEAAGCLALAELYERGVDFAQFGAVRRDEQRAATYRAACSAAGGGEACVR